MLFYFSFIKKFKIFAVLMHKGNKMEDNLKPQKDPYTSPTVVKERTRLNRLGVLLLLAIAAASTVVYVSNVIQVNDLYKDVSNMTKEYNELKYQNEIIRATINKLMEPERVTGIAKDKLGMIISDEAPQVLPSDLNIKSK